MKCNASTIDANRTRSHLEGYCSRTVWNNTVNLAPCIVIFKRTAEIRLRIILKDSIACQKGRRCAQEILRTPPSLNQRSPDDASATEGKFDGAPMGIFKTIVARNLYTFPRSHNFFSFYFFHVQSLPIYKRIHFNFIPNII